MLIYNIMKVIRVYHLYLINERSDMMFGYVYITQNLINKKQYIGQKKHICAHNSPFYQSQEWEIDRLRKGEKKDAD